MGGGGFDNLLVFFRPTQRIFHTLCEMLQILKYARHKSSLNSGSFRVPHVHLLWQGTSVLEDPWLSHLLPSVWLWKCHYLGMSRLGSEHQPVYLGFLSLSRIFHSFGNFTITCERLQILTYARHKRPLSSEGSLAFHTFCHRDIFLMVISEDLWHSHLLPSVALELSLSAITTKVFLSFAGRTL